ncbi:MAG: DNA alkylation repair protein, partial [Oscillospiraceae bacterium]
MNIIEAIREQLFSLADEKYRTFSASLLPNVDNIIGVRLPLLRNIAKEISKTNYEEYLYSDEHIYFEEIMICGMAIGYAKEPPQQKLGHVEKFIPRINNWSVCDSFCNTLKFTNNNKEKMFEFLQPYFHSDKEFYVRFAVVMLLNYYVSEDYLLDAM